MIDTVLDLVPEEYRDRFENFLDEPAVDDNSLRRQLEQYIVAVKAIAPMVKAFNLDKMLALAESGLALLEASAGDDEKRRVAQAVVRYLVEEEEDDEITGVLGLDDDLHVVNAAATAFGREDLIVRK